MKSTKPVSTISWAPKHSGTNPTSHVHGTRSIGGGILVGETRIHVLLAEDDPAQAAAVQATLDDDLTATVICSVRTV